MHTERIKGLVVFIAAIWLGACHDYVYCPCLLQEALSWAPISYSGKQISYVSSQDTIRLDCGAPTFSEQQKLPEENLNHCFIYNCQNETSIFQKRNVPKARIGEVMGI